MTLPQVGTQTDPSIVSSLIGQYNSTGDQSYLGQARRKAIELGLPEFVDMVSDVDGNPVSYAEKFETLQYAIRHERGSVFSAGTAVGDLYRELFLIEDVDVAFYRVFTRDSVIKVANHVTEAISKAADINDADARIVALYRGIINGIKTDNNAPPAIKELAEKATAALSDE